MKIRGFTLIELMITLAIVALLATLVVPFAQVAIQHQKEDRLYDTLRDIRAAIDEYKLAGDQGRVAREAGASGYPPNLRILIDGVPDQFSPVHQKIFFLRHLPPDPMSSDQDGLPEETWGLRSYASEASAPEAGEDVYDVYSKSPQIGLNGIPYKQW